MAGSSPYATLEPEKWRQLLAQATLLQSSAHRLADLHDAAVGSVANQAATALSPVCRAAAFASSTDKDAVTNAAAGWATELDAVIASGSIGGDASVALVTAVRADIDTLQILDHFAYLFAQVTVRAADVYASDWVQPSFDLGWLLERPRAGVDPYAFEALTTQVPQPTILLAIHPDGLGPAAYAALPAVMVHEAICHVAARPMGAADNGSPFAEGLMDWTAEHFFRTWIGQLNPALAPAAIDHARRLDQAVTRAGSTAGAARLRGRRAADRLVTWLTTARGKPYLVAVPSVAVLACRLNVVDASLAYKDAFVARINDAPWPDGLEAALIDVVEGRAHPSVLL